MGQVWRMGLCLLCLMVWEGCSGDKGGGAEASCDRLVLAAYTVPKEAYLQKVIPLFKEHWLRETGRKVEVETSFVASGAQARAIASGFDADVAALSLEGDMELLVESGRVDPDWRNNPYRGMVSRSLVVAMVRPGNPKKIKSWSDLVRNGVKIVYPSPRTSGGAMWVVNAIFGAGLKLNNQDENMAYSFLKKVQAQVEVMDSSGRAAVTTFELGVGDVLMTYENEVFLRQMQGKRYEIVYLSPTLLIENPVAIVRTSVKKHGSERVAEAFVRHLYDVEVQSAMAEFGFRSILPEVNRAHQRLFPTDLDIYDISFLGGWDEIRKKLYGEEGYWTKALVELGR